MAGEIRNKAISASNQVEVEVEVEAELCKKQRVRQVHYFFRGELVGG